MLRQALVDAEAGNSVNDRDRDGNGALVESSTPLTQAQSANEVPGYGATTPERLNNDIVRTPPFPSAHDDDNLSNIDDVDDDMDSTSDSEDEDEEQEVSYSFTAQLFKGVKTLFKVVVDVENLWDSPLPEAHESQAEWRRNRIRNKYVVLFWFVVAASSYATERASFKLLVDLAGPFRLVSVQMVTLSHAIMLGFSMLVAYYIRMKQRIGKRGMPLGIPLVDVALMAVLDTVSLLLAFLTGSHVPPTLTVILIQFTIPLTAFLTPLMNPAGRVGECGSNQSSPTAENDVGSEEDPLATDVNIYRFHFNSIDGPIDECQELPLVREKDPLVAHLWGSAILLVAVILALCPAMYAIGHPEFFDYADAIPLRTAMNTFFYAMSCLPAAASQLYKEHIFLQHKQPVNMDYLNLLLSIFQFVLASVVSPLMYFLQGLGRVDWKRAYPSSGFSDNFLDGLLCFFGLLSADDQQNKYPEYAECRFTFGLIIVHAFSIIAIGVAVDKIVNAGAMKLVYRGISAGIILAVLCMHVYDTCTPDFSYGPAIDALNLVCLVLLIIGSEVYHRASLQESTFETTYPMVEIPAFE